MDNKAVISDLRHKFSVNGWILLIYYGIIHFSLLIVAIIYWAICDFRPISDFETMQSVLDLSQNSAWGHLLACVIGGILLFVWKKSDFSFRKLRAGEGRMTLRIFFVLCCAILFVQVIQLFLMPVLEWLLVSLGFSSDSFMESADAQNLTFGMLLYVGIIAPVFEEMLFRGLVLRNLIPYGKLFAILASSFLFSIIHGDIMQMPSAFIAGFILGYVAVEYGLFWSISFHIIYNMVLGAIPTLISQILPAMYVYLVLYILFFVCTIFILILAAAKWRDIANYFIKSKIHPLYIKSFFTANGVIVFVAVTIINIVSYFF